jgi:hypothetical protein
MTTEPISVWRAFKAVIATLIGIAFYFAIIGVFGPIASIAALALFVVLALGIFRRAQASG